MIMIMRDDFHEKWVKMSSLSFLNTFLKLEFAIGFKIVTRV